MPPKAGGKATEKLKAKIIEDKTFGMKNKNKSKVVQQYVQSVHKAVDAKLEAKKRLEGPSRKEEKAEKERFQAELLSVFRPVQQTKVPQGAAASSVICEYFKQGLCQKGSKCKFSHDLSAERKGAKIDLYTDQRESKEDTGMEGWDQATLEEAVTKKANRVQTEIICKYFLDAVESRKYGWFWHCPNGNDKCIYRHALPPGYVLRSAEKKKAEEDQGPQVILEEELEEERKRITGSTPVTLETFLEWRRKKKERSDAEAAAEVKKQADAGKHKKPTQMSGRALFQFNPELFVDDDEGVEAYERREDEDEDVVTISASGTSISYARKRGGDGEEDGEEGGEEEGEGGGRRQGGERDDEDDDAAAAAAGGGGGRGGGSAAAAAAAGGGGGGGGMPIQASLFLEGDVPEDFPEDDDDE